MFSNDMEYGSFGMAEENAKRAFELYSNASWNQALEEIQTALDMNPYNSTWHFNKALTLDNIEQFAQAIKAYKQALELNPNDLDTLNCIAVDYTRTGQYDLAIKIFEEIQSIDPNFEPCYCNRIIAYTEMEKHDQAEQMFYMAQQVEPNCPLCFYNIGNSLFIRGQYDRAISCWKKTSQLEPAHPQINYRIAQAYWAKGDMNLTNQYFLEELRIDPGNTDVLIDFGLFLLQNGDIYSAGEKFHRITELDPSNANAIFYSGEIAFESGNSDGAIELYKLAVQKENTMLGPRFRLAQCATQCGDKKSARVFLIQEFDLAPEDASVLLTMGKMFADLAEYEYARWCFLRVIENDSANSDAYHSLGVLAAMQNNLSEAQDYFAHALDINGDCIDSLRDSAQICWLTDRLDDGLMRIDKACSLAPEDEESKSIRRKIRFSQFAEIFTNSFEKLKNRSKSTVS